MPLGIPVTRFVSATLIKQSPTIHKSHRTSIILLEVLLQKWWICSNFAHLCFALSFLLHCLPVVCLIPCLSDISLFFFVGSLLSASRVLEPGAGPCRTVKGSLYLADLSLHLNLYGDLPLTTTPVSATGSPALFWSKPYIARRSS